MRSQRAGDFVEIGIAPSRWIGDEGNVHTPKLDCGPVPEGSSPFRAQASTTRSAEDSLLMADTNRRIAVGFQGGQTLPLRVPEDQLSGLRDTLRNGGARWHEVAAADGAVLVDLQQVVYLRVESDENRVGF